MPTPHDVQFFATPAQLRAWFTANHKTAPELWVGYHHKSSGRQSITWQNVVDQALCYGWIDSVRYSLGDHVSATRITPRRKGSVWSDINIKRFRELERMGAVRSAGRAAFAKRDEARSRIYSYENRAKGFDAPTEAKFRGHKRAWKFFEAQAPFYKRTVTFWVMSAKQAETRERRLKRLIEHSQNGERVPPFVTPSRRRRAP